jgi:hypothetical protein
MSREITVHHSKTLKLENALSVDLTSQEDFEQLLNLQALADRMDLHIRQKGAQPIGPLIQKNNIIVNEVGETQIVITMIRQADVFIHCTDPPYRMESMIRVSDCLYTRFVGEEGNLKFAYSKLQLVGYEEGIHLSAETYTVLVAANEDDGTITADIFVPKAG